MKSVAELTESEDQTLQQLSVKHKHRDARTRAAGVLLLGRRVKLTEIPAKLGVSDQSVYNWTHAWRGHKVCGLLTGHKEAVVPARCPKACWPLRRMKNECLSFTTCRRRDAEYSV